MVGPTLTRWEPVVSHGGAMTAHRGLVLHVQAGDSDPGPGWFANPANEASSHWWVSKAGELVGYVDPMDIAWAQKSGNAEWSSCESEGYPTEPLTTPQILTLARLYSWGMSTFGWPCQPTDNPLGRGLGWHGMGGDAWGHPNCPGDIRKGQRGAVLYLASLTVAAPPPKRQGGHMLATTPTGHGYWVVKPDGSVWSYGDAQTVFGYHGGCNAGAPYAPGKVSGPGGLLPPGGTAIGITATPDGKGYWILSNSLAVYAFGSATYMGAP